MYDFHNANETVMKNDIIREKMMLLKRSVKKKVRKGRDSE